MQRARHRDISREGNVKFLAIVGALGFAYLTRGAMPILFV